jgi:large subunit ribosomal protein L19
METIRNIEREQIRMDLPHFTAGDTVTVHVKIREGN